MDSNDLPEHIAISMDYKGTIQIGTNHQYTVGEIVTALKLYDARQTPEILDWMSDQSCPGGTCSVFSIEELKQKGTP